MFTEVNTIGWKSKDGGIYHNKSIQFTPVKSTFDINTLVNPTIVLVPYYRKSKQSSFHLFINYAARGVYLKI